MLKSMSKIYKIGCVTVENSSKLRLVKNVVKYWNIVPEACKNIHLVRVEVTGKKGRWGVAVIAPGGGAGGNLIPLEMAANKSWLELSKKGLDSVLGSSLTSSSSSSEASSPEASMSSSSILDLGDGESRLDSLSFWKCVS